MKKILSFITIALLALTCTACGAKNDPSGISKDEFDQINMGMTIFKVEEIVGGKGTKISESKDETDDYYINLKAKPAVTLSLNSLLKYLKMN